MKAPDYILAIDPGTVNIGYALLGYDSDYLLGGIIKVEKEDKLNLGKLRNDLIAVFIEVQKTITHGSLLVVIEEFGMFGLRASVINAFDMGRVIQLIKDVFWTFYLNKTMNFPYPMSAKNWDVRQWLCGNGTAKPAQVKEALKLMGVTQKTNEHVRDAIALGLYSWYMRIWEHVNG
ncbi:MAG: hypothetical protein WC476_01325 [Phycisphaerae bacterium]|jgi:Holliday junction resolvasome RuvABC endonuclease subunit